MIIYLVCYTGEPLFIKARSGCAGHHFLFFAGFRLGVKVVHMYLGGMSLCQQCFVTKNTEVFVTVADPAVSRREGHKSLIDFLTNFSKHKNE